MNRQADRNIRVTGPVHQRYQRRFHWLQLELGSQITYSEMLAEMDEQVVDEHVLAGLRKKRGRQ